MQLEKILILNSRNKYTSQETISFSVDLNDFNINAIVVKGASLKCLYSLAYLNGIALICSSKPTTPKVYVVNEAERIQIRLLFNPTP